MIERYFTVSSQSIWVAVSTLYRSSLKKAVSGHRLMLPGLFCLIVASAMLVFPITALAGEKYGTFTSVGEMNIPRSYHTATLLPNGKVLIAGGQRGFHETLDSAELYDPALHKFTLTGKMLSAPRGSHRDPVARWKGARRRRISAWRGLPSAELYDPISGTFSPTGAMVKPRQWSNSHVAFQRRSSHYRRRDKRRNNSNG